MGWALPPVAISIPMLAIENSADDAIPGSHTKRFFNAYGGKDKTYKLMKGANHYYVDQPEKLAQAVDLIHGWLDEKAVVTESLLSIKRAGADAILTYFAERMAQWLAE